VGLGLKTVLLSFFGSFVGPHNHPTPIPTLIPFSLAWHLGICSYCYLNGVLTLPLHKGAIGHKEIQFNFGISQEGLGKFAR
jgi:hypothetical protein